MNREFWRAVLRHLRGEGYGDPYPPEAAEAPDYGFERARPLTEVGPLVVAGSDLDRAHQPMSLVNLTLRLMVDADPELAAMSSRAETLAGLCVAPEVDR